MSKVLPAGWSATVLQKILYRPLAYGVLKPGKHVEKGIPVIRIQDIRDGKLNYDGLYRISSELHKEFKRTELNSGDLIISLVGTIGKTFVVPAKLQNANVTRAFGVIGVRKEVSSLFVAQSLNSDETQSWIQDQSQGNAQRVLNIGSLKQLPICLPSLPEQQKIAAILSSVDDVIEKTRAQIDKLKDLKTGMMQELLTKGIGHTEFKDSPVGRIPATWEVVTLESLLAAVEYPMRSGPFGSALLKEELVEDGIPLLGIDNVHVERFDSNYKRFVTEEKYQELSRYAVRERDVMVTIMGTVGRCCVVPKGVGKALSSKHVWTMTFDEEKYIAELICWQVNYADWVETQFKNESQGGVMESISSKTLRALLVPMPPLEEQKKIGEAHSKISSAIAVKADKFTSLIRFKKALMQDLLTGKVRVKLNNNETTAASIQAAEAIEEQEYDHAEQ